MDGCDDSHFSPIVMLAKFPNLQKLSAANRPENTNLEMDIKLLQEMLNEKTLNAGEFQLTKLNIHHYQMEYEVYHATYQRLLNKLSAGANVELDIRPCGNHEPVGDDVFARVAQMITMRNHGVEEDNTCQRIIKKDSRCWSCGYVFGACWKCEVKCNGCQLKRIPPLPNDNQIKLKTRKHWATIPVANNAEDEEDLFRLFS
jgi:hypothetical protein